MHFLGRRRTDTMEFVARQTGPFDTMQRLEDESEDNRPDERDGSDVFAKIALVETAIEDRFPAQLSAPYRDWQQRRAISLSGPNDPRTLNGCSSSSTTLLLTSSTSSQPRGMGLLSSSKRCRTFWQASARLSA